LDLSGLDLTGITLNGVRCSRYYKNSYLAAVFDGARLHEQNLLPQGHTDRVNSAVYSPDGGEILSASRDHTIKEWDRKTGVCLLTLTGYSNFVYIVTYCPDGQKIRSTSWEGIIKVWDATSGTCLNTYKKEDNPVIPDFSPDERNIVLKISNNKITVPNPSGKGKARTIINVPGLFIQGCSFKNLDQGCQWTPEGLEILRQYGGKTGS
jgi:WD40 repeat protein